MRLIDADALLKLLDEPERYGYLDAMDIEDAPTIEPMQWIPCSERLPEETMDYLCWVINPYDESIQYHMICTYYAGAKKWCPIDEKASSNVVAWMPLPKPYQKEKSNV